MVQVCGALSRNHDCLRRAPKQRGETRAPGYTAKLGAFFPPWRSRQCYMVELHTNQLFFWQLYFVNKELMHQNSMTINIFLFLGNRKQVQLHIIKAWINNSLVLVVSQTKTEKSILYKSFWGHSSFESIHLLTKLRVRTKNNKNLGLFSISRKKKRLRFFFQIRILL